MAEAMSDERLARLNADNEPRGDHLSGLTADEVGELLDEVKRLRAHLVAERLATEAAEADNDWLRAQLAELGETREEWGYGDAPERIVMPFGQGYRNGTPRQWAVEAARRSRVKVWMCLAGEWREVPHA